MAWLVTILWMVGDPSPPPTQPQMSKSELMGYSPSPFPLDQCTILEHLITSVMSFALIWFCSHCIIYRGLELLDVITTNVVLAHFQMVATNKRMSF